MYVQVLTQHGEDHRQDDPHARRMPHRLFLSCRCSQPVLFPNISSPPNCNNILVLTAPFAYNSYTYTSTRTVRRHRLNARSEKKRACLSLLSSLRLYTVRARSRAARRTEELVRARRDAFAETRRNSAPARASTGLPAPKRRRRALCSRRRCVI